MKKITFLFCLLVFSLGFSQNLVTNGDFETGDGSNWGGNSANGTNINVIDDGSGNFVNQSIITTAGQGWQVGIDQALTLTQGEFYELSFDASSSVERTIIAGIGKAGGDFASNTQSPTITTTTATYTFTLEANFDTVTDGARVLFDLGEVISDVTLDNISLTLTTTTCDNGVQDGDEEGVDCGGSCDPCLTPPSEEAPTPPARDPADVKSIFSNSYSDIATSAFTIYDGAHSVTTFDIGSNTTLASTPNTSGNAFAYEYFSGGSGTPDISDMNTLHVDVYLNVAADPGAVWQAKVLSDIGRLDQVVSLDLGLVTPGTWYSADLPIDLTGYTDLDLLQIFAAGPINYGTIYMDNIYFHNNQLLSTDQFGTAEFSVFPNPTNGEWNINSSSEMSKVALFDILGKEVLTITPNALEATIDASSFKTGVYFARIEGVNGTKTVKLIRQ